MNKLKVRVVRKNGKFFPQYKWEKSGFDVWGKDSFLKKEWSHADELCKTLFEESDWCFVYSTDKLNKEAICFDDAESAIKYAKRLKDNNNPTVVWEG